MTTNTGTTDSLALPSPAHRDSRPQWAFHTAVAYLAWFGQVAVWWWSEPVVQVRGKDAVFVSACVFTLLGAVVALGSLR